MSDDSFACLQNPVSLKMLICVRRQPAMSLPDFLHYWLHNHAPLALSAYERGHAPPMLGYLQNHSLLHSAVEQCAEANGMPQRSYDGLTEVWLNNIDDLDMSAQLSEDLAATNALLIADEASFVDLPDSRVFAVECEQAWSKPQQPDNVVKLVLLVRRNRGLTDADQQTLRINEAKALKQWCESEPSLIAFTQSRAADSPLMDAFRLMRGMNQPPYDDVLELWCDAASIDQQLAAICEQLVSLYAQSAVDFSDSCLYLTQPYRIF